MSKIVFQLKFRNSSSRTEYSSSTASTVASRILQEFQFTPRIPAEVQEFQLYGLTTVASRIQQQLYKLNVTASLQEFHLMSRNSSLGSGTPALASRIPAQLLRRAELPQTVSVAPSLFAPALAAVRPGPQNPSFFRYGGVPGG